MALERTSQTPPPVDGETDGVTNGGGGDDGSKTPRLPRWTRQEILVLIQGKRVAENRVRRGRTAGLAFGSGQVEPKWASVSSYCRRHGVNRGPVQCRKRWSNLAGDYKKIREWENQTRDETESFWVMRNDLRRERRLPGYFDREVYDILDGGPAPAVAPVEVETTPSPSPTMLALALTPAPATETEEVEVEAVFDSGRSATAEDGLFSDFEQSGQDDMGLSPDKDLPPVMEVPTISVPAPVPISEKQYQPFFKGGPTQGATAKEKKPTVDPEIGTTSQQGHKRRRFSTGEEEDEPEAPETGLQHQLIEALEKNGRMLSAQLEAQNANIELDREQRRGHADSLVAVLNKLADALGRIAEKL